MVKYKGFALNREIEIGRWMLCRHEKKHWRTVCLFPIHIRKPRFMIRTGSLCDTSLIKKHFFVDGSIPLEDVKIMIAESNDLVSDSPSKRIYEAVKKIPKGRVATYGMVAEAAGDKKMARAVGNALHNNPDPENIPCYRVVNAKGELAGHQVYYGYG